MKLKQTLVLLLLLFTGSAMAQTVKWFAGIVNDVDPETHYNNSNTISPSNAYFYNPSGIAIEPNGRIWITESNKIRLYNAGTFHNRAGNFGVASSSLGYQNKTGNQAAFYNPAGIVVAADGVLFIADEGNNAIRRMDAYTGQNQSVSTFAGDNATGATNYLGQAGYVDATEHNARFNAPKGIAMDKNGNLYVTEFGEGAYTIRKITSGKVVTTLAGKSGEKGSTNGNGDGKTARFAGPYGIAIYDDNHIVVSDFDNGMIRKIKTLDGTVVQSWGNASDQSRVDGDFTKARFASPKGLVVAAGKIYVCDGPVIRVIDINAQTVSTFAGSEEEGNKDGEGTAARFGRLEAIAYDGKTTLYVSDIYYNIIKTVSINNLAPNIDFTANETKPVVNKDVVTLSYTNSGVLATSQEWKIEPTTFTYTSGTKSSASIGVKFTVTGFYKVTLDVTNGYGTTNKVKADYIQVSTVGIKQVPSNVSIGVYPNPSNGSFTLQSLYGNYPIQSYSVMDLNGKVILTKICNNSMSESFDISTYQNGFYFLRVNTSNGSNTLKLQKI